MPSGAASLCTGDRAKTRLAQAEVGRMQTASDHSQASAATLARARGCVKTHCSPRGDPKSDRTERQNSHPSGNDLAVNTACQSH
jgi:hypothetical protein